MLQTIFSYTATENYGDDKEFEKVMNRELNYVLSQQENNKALGADSLDVLVIKNLCIIFPRLMTEL